MRYWKPIILALVIAVVCTAWRIDRASQYRDGKAALMHLLDFYKVVSELGVINQTDACVVLKRNQEAVG